MLLPFRQRWTAAMVPATRNYYDEYPFRRRFHRSDRFVFIYIFIARYWYI
jgi:hypothetical protein